MKKYLLFLLILLGIEMQASSATGAINFPEKVLEPSNALSQYTPRWVLVLTAISPLGYIGIHYTLIDDQEGASRRLTLFGISIGLMLFFAMLGVWYLSVLVLVGMTALNIIDCIKILKGDMPEGHIKYTRADRRELRLARRLKRLERKERLENRCF